MMGVVSFFQKRMRTSFIFEEGCGTVSFKIFFPFVRTAVLTIWIIWEILTFHLEGIVMIKHWSKEIFEIVCNFFWMRSWPCLTKESHDTDSKEKLIKHYNFYLHREINNEVSVMFKNGYGSKVILTSSSFFTVLDTVKSWILGKCRAIYSGYESGFLPPPWSGIYAMILPRVFKN